MGVAEALGVAFVILKLLGVIAWSWLWVLSPFWIMGLIYLLVFVVWAIFVKKFILDSNW